MRKITAETTVEELSGIVAEHLRLHGIEVVLSGGALNDIQNSADA